MPKRPLPVVHQNNIRLWRKAAGWTLEQMAEEADMSPSNLSLLERGMTNWTRPALEKLVKALRLKGLHLEPSDLIDRKPDDRLATIISSAKRLSEDQQDGLIEFLNRMTGNR